MAPTRLRPFLAPFLVAALVLTAAACERDAVQGDDPPVEPPPEAGVCTGSVPANATPCPGTDVGLTTDAPRVVQPSCQATPCSYACNAGFFLAGGTCQAVSPPADIEFLDRGDGTVWLTDNSGTTVWLKDGNCLESLGGVDRGGGPVIWSDAVKWSSGLASGACGLTDGSTPGDWALPDLTELLHLGNDLTLEGEPARLVFANIQEIYWTAFSTCVGFQAAVNIDTGVYTDVKEGGKYGVWPVRRVDR